MESTSLMTVVRRRRVEKSRKEYKSPYVVTLPPSSELLLLDSLAQLADDKVRNADIKNRIDIGVQTIRRLLKSYPSSTKGGFRKSIVRLRTAIRSLPKDDVDPEYYSVIEEGLVDKVDHLRTRIESALEWERRKIEKEQKPETRTVDTKVIADPKNNILSILMSDHKINIEFLYRESIRLTNKLKAAQETVQKVNIPESTQKCIAEIFEKLIQCFSMEASIPFKLRGLIEKLLDQLMLDQPFGSGLVDMVKMMRVKTDNCLLECTREKKNRVDQLKEISRSFQGLDSILSETNRPYWMMDMPNTFDRRKLPFEAGLKAYRESMKIKCEINEPEVKPNCLCHGLANDNMVSIEAPLCSDMLSYTREIKSRLGIPDFERPGSCHCAWLFSPPVYKGSGKHYNDATRLFTTATLRKAKECDIIKDVTSCFCNWMQLRNIFGPKRTEVCPAAYK